MEPEISVINTVIFFLLAALHLYWAVGGNSGINATIPTDVNGRKLFRPSRGITLVMAMGLSLFGLCNIAFAGIMHTNLDPLYFRYSILLIAVIFFLRAIGDFRYIGLTKRHKQSLFALWDTRLYTPLCLILAASHFFLYMH
ncbi:DUF3995 domain-containing protein [Sphingobacterium shayense]|uniref:DUF3995 domain-containing protein n=1 Tax=Sphingobacterium shayense TaxID=626343 RepID=UPI0015548C22|nr:DUF3995 domain-containing protein [Sphingobacterium shayense]